MTKTYYLVNYKKRDIDVVNVDSDSECRVCICGLWRNKDTKRGYYTSQLTEAKTRLIDYLLKIEQDLTLELVDVMDTKKRVRML